MEKLQEKEVTDSFCDQINTLDNYSI